MGPCFCKSAECYSSLKRLNDFTLTTLDLNEVSEELVGVLEQNTADTFL